MLRHPHAQSESHLILWIGAVLALASAVAYLLIAAHLLSVGDLLPSEQPAGIVFFTAGSYLIGGILILLRRRWLWLFGAIVNAMVILFFFQLYDDRPTVMFSAGGVATKAAQILLELVLVYLLVTDRTDEQAK